MTHLKIVALSLPLVGLTLATLHSQTKEDPTYADTIAPIINKHCIDCHHDGGIGPFSLTSYEDVRKRSRQIAEVTSSRYMPPWKPDPHYGPPLKGERRLSENEIELIQQWRSLGNPAGDLSRLPPLPEFQEWKLGQPDLIVELDTPYTLAAEGTDVYRNFVVSLPIEEPIFVRAFELLPDTRLAIHHALLMLDTSGRARIQDQSESGPGYDGMGIGSSVPPSGHIVGWTPGQMPYEAYPGTAWEIKPGTDLVLQLHLLPSGKPEVIRPKIGLYLSEEPPDTPSFVLQMRSYELDIPAGESDYLVEQSFPLSSDVKVVSVYPHTHYLGKDIQLFATLPDGSKEWLLRIPDWDFNWQSDFRYQEPPILPGGSVIHMAYHFDNSSDNPRNPNYPPKDVRGGWRSEDEMAEAMIQVIPVNPDDLSKLREDQKEYDFKLAGGEARFHYYSGIYLEQQNELDRAIQSYLRTVQIDPTFESGYFKLGSIYERLGDIEQAEALYREALAYNPELVPAQLGLAKLLMMTSRIRQAGFILTDVYEANPTHLQTNLYLARYHFSRGNQTEAINLLEAGKGSFENAPEYHLEYGRLLMESGEAAEAAQKFQLALQAVPLNREPDYDRTLDQVYAEAHYDLATHLLDEGMVQEADHHLDDCLKKNSNHLDALLKSAALAIETQQNGKALSRLKDLVRRPADKTFSREDILAHLPEPKGEVLLEKAYELTGD